VIAASALGNGFVGLALQTANFAALLSFLETQGSVSVLSSPRIATINNQKAVLKVGTDELYVTNITTTSTSTTSGTTATPSLTLQPYFSGISLDVTPQIDDEGNIILHVHPAISSVAERNKVIDLGSMGSFTLPLASSSVNETDSIVRVQDGNIVAIGGLMTQEQSSDRSGLPGTVNSPAGALLGQRGSKSVKRELVILLKPTIIRDDRAWVKDLEESGERIRALGRPTVPMPRN
jgi:MSHA biogenesis protein MshL